MKNINEFMLDTIILRIRREFGLNVSSMAVENQLEDLREALEIVRSAMNRADDFGKRDLWRIESYLCRRATAIAQVDPAKPHWKCRCGVVAMPLTDDTKCDCGDIYEQDWVLVSPQKDADLGNCPDCQSGTMRHRLTDDEEWWECTACKFAERPKL